jgi:hypothetical protein
VKLPKSKGFAQKHGPNAKPDRSIEAEILKRSKNNELPCAVAFKIAEDMEISADLVGITADLIDFRLTKCQLGLFGYQPEKKIVKPKSPVDPKLEPAIQEARVGDKLPCKDAWHIAFRFNIRKMAVSSACEALQVKIKPCQLGAF